jgi:aspartate aminotransferase
MALAKRLEAILAGGTLIRKMFNQGQELIEKYGADQVYDLSIGNPDLSPPPEFYEAARRILESEIPMKHAYMNNAGYPETRRRIAERVSREQETPTPWENIVMTVGAGGALSLSFFALVNPGDEVLVNAPAFVAYNNYLSVHGGVLKVVPGREDFDLNLEEMENMIGPKTAAVIINSPNNPSGFIYPEASLKALGDMLERASARIGRRIYLISDEPYREIIYRDEPVPAIFTAYPHSIICYSYSKALSVPGERIGWAAVHPGADEAGGLVKGMTGATLNMGYTNAPALMQRIIAEIDGSIVDVERYRSRKDVMVSGLREIGYEFIEPEGAFYLFPKAPGGDDLAFCDALVTERILAVPGVGFAMPGYFRLSYCVDEDIIRRSMPGFRRIFEQLNSAC